MSHEGEMVKIILDDEEVVVAKGTNLIEVARQAGSDIPHYCYHKHLSVAGNCRMCQVKVEGMPKLTIACNTVATEGMVVRTHLTSDEVRDAQRATMEFLLINHPLDCTVCDQAGHCKLQDYYYEYNAKASRFTENKVHQVKAEPLGPEVIYDGERCIVCSRCVRFTDEVTKTGELGIFNRGDRSVVGIFPEKQLDNPFSGCVVDLCPVGALTHRRWRFNTRVWYTKATDSICPGCSTGCNVSAFVRQGEVVNVKGRLNSDVNQEWLCDEGRYGFGRFQAKGRALGPSLRKRGEQVLHEVSYEEAIESVCTELEGRPDAQPAVLLSPFMTMEESWVAVRFSERLLGLKPDSEFLSFAYRRRTLSELERILVADDYSPNIRVQEVLGLSDVSDNWQEQAASRYDRLLALIEARKVQQLFLVGDFALVADSLSEALESALRETYCVAITSHGVVGNQEKTCGCQGSCHSEDNSKCSKLGCVVPDFASALFPTHAVLEKDGVYVNRDLRFQRIRSLLASPEGVRSEWEILRSIAKARGVSLLDDSVVDNRTLCQQMVGDIPALKNLSYFRVGDLGVSWRELYRTQ